MATARQPLWGHETEVAIANFPISGRPLDHRVVYALCAIKRHAAAVNAELGVAGLDAAAVAAIERAALAVESGSHDDAFPIDVFQTGSGTSTNMNVNEVLATLAADGGPALHPNDQINASQSSNDTVPTAIRVALARELAGNLHPAVAALAEALAAAGARFAEVVKAGRTHLMDATPVTLGQEFDAWATMLELANARSGADVEALCELPLGGTAVGTGINAPAAFAPRVVERLAAELALPLRAAPTTPRRMAHMGGQGALADCSAGLRGIAIALTKIANDIRLLASGPATGIAELRLPELQKGSSIMPGKVNPVLCESTNQVAARVFGNDAVVAFAASQGILELNTYLPVMADALLESATLLGRVCRLFAARAIAGIEADVERCRRNAERTPSLATVLNPLIGYDAAAEAVREALRTDRTIRDVVAGRGDVEPAQLDELLDPLAMTRPGTRPGATRPEGNS